MTRAEKEVKAIMDRAAEEDEAIAEMTKAFNEECTRILRILRQMPGDLGFVVGAMMATTLRMTNTDAYNQVVAGLRDWMGEDGSED